jgi:hypothetical protein
MTRNTRWKFLLGFVIAAAVFSASGFAQGRAKGEALQEPYAGAALCLPDVTQATDCLAMGPAAKLAELANLGIPVPDRGLPTYSPDRGLSNAPVSFARINLDPSKAAPIYATLDDAVAGQNIVRYIPAGRLRFVSIMNQTRVDGVNYVQLLSGEWMAADPASYSHFQGVQFRSAPQGSMGWIVQPGLARTGPSYANPQTGDTLVQGTLVRIYDQKQANGTTWYMIGLDEWLERRYVHELSVDTTPPPGVDNGRWIEVNLFDQTLTVYDQGQPVFATLVSSGSKPFYTRPGLFKIYKKLETDTMSGAFEPDRSDYYYLQDVPYVLYFDEARALHGTYWHTMFGYPTSHGCVNLPMGDAHWLYDWANVGDWVYVVDPSGQTPTDPSYYGAGGA